jgi:hypothetical protein
MLSAVQWSPIVQNQSQAIPQPSPFIIINTGSSLQWAKRAIVASVMAPPLLLIYSTINVRDLRP